MEKNEIRKLYKTIRKEVKNRETKENAIKAALLKKICNANSVFIYKSIGGEVDTENIIRSLKQCKRVYYPEVHGNGMKLVSDDGSYSDKPCDVTVVPLIAFNRGLDRIGFGGGYYDRYLAENDTLSIGIAFDEQQCDEILPEPTDVALDIIITPTRVLEKK